MAVSFFFVAGVNWYLVRTADLAEPHQHRFRQSCVAPADPLD